MSERIVMAAERWLGTPYRHQAATRGAGCDCLGLVRGVWREVVGTEPWAVPPYRAGWRGVDEGLVAAAERWLARAEGFSAGRVVLFRLHRNLPPRHCGILISETRFIHAQEQIGVVAADLTESWRRRVAGVFRFPAIG